MKTTSIRTMRAALGGAVMALALNAGGMALADDNEIAFTKLPAPVQAAARTQLNGGEIKEEAKTVVADGRVLYVVQVDHDKSGPVLYHIDPAGAVLKSSESIELKAVPVNVQAAAKQLLGKGDELDDKARIETYNGIVSYEVEIDRDGMPDLKVGISIDGVVLSQRVSESESK